MSTHLGRDLLGEICTLKHGQQIWIGQIVEIDQDQFAIRLFEDKEKSPLPEQQHIKITIEPMDQEIHLLNAELISEDVRENERILLFKSISEIQFQSKRQDPRLPLSSPLEFLYRAFPPSYHSWEQGSFLNISIGGAQFVGDQYFSNGDLIEIKLGTSIFADEEIVISRIVHVASDDGQYFFSIQFLNLQETHKNLLEKYIESMLSH